MDCGEPLAYSTSGYTSTLKNLCNSPVSHLVEEISFQNGAHDGSPRVLASLHPGHLSACYQPGLGYCEQDASPCRLNTSCSYSAAIQQTHAASVYPLDLACTTPQNTAERDFLPVSEQAATFYSHAQQQQEQQLAQKSFAAIPNNAYGGQAAVAYASSGATNSYCLACTQQQQTHACCHNLQQVPRQQKPGVFVCPPAIYSLACRTPSCQQQPCCGLYHSPPPAAVPHAELQYQRQQCGYGPCVFVHSASLQPPCYASCCPPPVQQQHCVACMRQRPQHLSCLPEGSCCGAVLAMRQVLCMQQQPLLQEAQQQLVYQRTLSNDLSVSPLFDCYMGDDNFSEGSACVHFNSSVSSCSGHFGSASPSACPVGKLLPASTEPELQQTPQGDLPSLFQAAFSAGDKLQPLGGAEEIKTVEKQKVVTPIVGVGGLLCLPPKRKQRAASSVQWHVGFRQLLGKEGRAELIKRMRIVHRNHPEFCDQTLHDIGFPFRRLPHATVEKLWQIAYQWGLFEFALRVARKGANWVHHERPRKPTKKQMVKTDEEEVARDETENGTRGTNAGGTAGY